MTDVNNVPHKADSLDEQLHHASEELIIGDSDDPPLSDLGTNQSDLSFSRDAVQRHSEHGGEHPQPRNTATFPENGSVHENIDTIARTMQLEQEGFLRIAGT
jgi:hypothetical protein